MSIMPPKGKPFSARWSTMAGMSSVLTPSSRSVVGMPRSLKKLLRRAMPSFAVRSTSIGSSSQPKTSTAKRAKRAGFVGIT